MSAEGEIEPDDQVRRDGTTDWTSADAVRDFSVKTRSGTRRDGAGCGP